MGNVGLPDGGVPPQGPQQGQFPQQQGQFPHQQGIPMNPIGLPDGGVPPQSQALPSQPQGFQPAAPTPSQPIDLSALEGPGAAKQAAQPPAATIVGHVHVIYSIFF